MTRLIDADALIKKWENVHSKDMSFEMAIIGATNDVKKAPTVDAVPVRHGYWQITSAYPHNVYCSVCHKRFAQTQWGVWEDGSLPRNYCPNCGARMDEE